MSDLVKIQNNEGRAGTKIIADGFNRRHEQVTRLVKKYQGHFEKINTLCVAQSDGKTKPFQEFFLDYDQVLFLISLLKNNATSCQLKLEAIQRSSIAKVIDLLRTFDFGTDSSRFVYAVMDEKGRIKIGISNNPKKRVESLNVGNADKLTLIFTREATGPGYSDEVLLHDKCSPFKIRSEWFTNQAMEALT